MGTIVNNPNFFFPQNTSSKISWTRWRLLVFSECSQSIFQSFLESHLTESDYFWLGNAQGCALLWKPKEEKEDQFDLGFRIEPDAACHQAGRGAALEVDALLQTAPVDSLVLQNSVAVADPLGAQNVQRLQHLRWSMDLFVCVWESVTGSGRDASITCANS